jgi:hypothetical protein
MKTAQWMGCKKREVYELNNSMRFCVGWGKWATKRQEAYYMVVQEHVIGEDGGVPDAQPERGVEALHERHDLNRLAASYELLNYRKK